MVFNATFNNISVISWRSVLLVEETGENQQPVASHWQTLSLVFEDNIIVLKKQKIWDEGVLISKNDGKLSENSLNIRFG
jgi:hypothetical protein